MKKLFIKIRSSIKLLVLLSIATILIVGAVSFFYKPIYSVYLNGELIGYCDKKSDLQKKINEYVENGDNSNDNLAFVEIDNMPTYKLGLLKRNVTTNEDEIFETIAKTGVSYYKYYAVLEDNKEKLYVSDFKTAQSVVEGLKKKNSNNIDNITIKEKYETDMKKFTSKETAIAKLYEKKVVTPKSTSTRITPTGGRISTSTNIARTKVPINVALIRPVSGVISSRFGSSSRLRSSSHTGLDIATSRGTPIKVAASGTVSYAGWKGSYGNMVVVSHGNGVQTYYAHCSAIYVKAGQKVKQGEKIAAVGSTGNSTGPHLHLEVRVNGVAYNPQNYVY